MNQEAQILVLPLPLTYILKPPVSNPSPLTQSNLSLSEQGRRNNKKAEERLGKGLAPISQQGAVVLVRSDWLISCLHNWTTWGFLIRQPYELVLSQAVIQGSRLLPSVALPSSRSSELCPFPQRIEIIGWGKMTRPASRHITYPHVPLVGTQLNGYISRQGRLGNITQLRVQEEKEIVCLTTSQILPHKLIPKF